MIPFKLICATLDKSRVLSLLVNNQLNSIATNIGTTTSAAGIRFLNNTYITVPSNSKYIMAAKDFNISSKFTIHNNINGTVHAAGTSVTSLLSWNGWLAVGTLNNYDLAINNLANSVSFTIGNFDTRISASFNFTFAKNVEYILKLERVDGVLSLYVNSVKIGEQAFNHNIAYNTVTPMRVGLRVGGANDSYWYSDMTIKELTLDIF